MAVVAVTFAFAVGFLFLFSGRGLVICPSASLRESVRSGRAGLRSGLAGLRSGRPGFDIVSSLLRILCVNVT